MALVTYVSGAPSLEKKPFFHTYVAKTWVDFKRTMLRMTVPLFIAICSMTLFALFTAQECQAS